MPCFLFFFTALIASALATPESIILYQFQEKNGSQILDSSGIHPPANLTIPDQGKITRKSGSLTINQPTLLATKSPPIKLITAVQKSGELTFAAWITPANLTQSGPARIVSLSKDSSNRNATLGQDGSKFDARFRTQKTGPNGIPSLNSARVTTTKTHLVFTRDKNGKGLLYLNGRPAGQQNFPGSINNWDKNYRLALGNEFTNDRPWLGTFHQVAIYAKALSPSDVSTLFQQGPTPSKPKPPLTAAERSRDLFVNHIEPIISRHCLECHDSTTAEGDLDLSSKKAAFSDPEIIFAGHLKKSLLWESVDSDEMPEKRTPLSAEEKAHLREWIATGATWTSEHLDPAAHLLLTDPKKFPRRLTVPEYIATVKATTGVDIAQEARDLLPPDLRTDGFRNTAYNLGVDLKHVEAHARLANLIVSKLDVKKFAARFSKNRSTTQKPILKHIQETGTFLLRGPLSDRELHLYQGIATSVGSGGGDFDEAFAYILRAMLQSPRYLYRIEGQGSPSSYELASRLSYLIWGSSPDQALLDAAKNNFLHDPAQLKKQVERMLRDPRSVEQSLNFITEWLNLTHLKNLQPKSTDWNPQLATDMRRETLAFARHLLWKEKRPLGDLLNARVTFLTPALARHYGLEPKSEPFAKYDVSHTSRGGLLTQGSLLTIGGDEASMVTRGLFVLHDLLRGSVKDPPPGVDTTPVPIEPGLSQRAVAMNRLSDNSCGGCHAKFEPLAFGLEQYDGLARFSLKDHFKNDLRQDGEILIPGTSEMIKYKTSRELMDLLAKSPRVRQNIIWKLAQFSLGRPIANQDRPHLNALIKAVANDQTYQNVITRLALSPLTTR